MTQKLGKRGRFAKVSGMLNLQRKLIIAGTLGDDFCLELSKIKVLKMLDLQTKSAIDSDNMRVLSTVV